MLQIEDQETEVQRDYDLLYLPYLTNEQMRAWNYNGQVQNNDGVFRLVNWNEVSMRINVTLQVHVENLLHENWFVFVEGK